MTTGEYSSIAITIALLIISGGIWVYDQLRKDSNVPRETNPTGGQDELLK